MHSGCYYYYDRGGNYVYYDDYTDYYEYYDLDSNDYYIIYDELYL